MTGAYLWLKFVHVLGAIVWVGSMIALSAAGSRRIRESDSASARVLMRQQSFITSALILPSTIVTVLTGIALGHLMGGMQPWAIWGMLVAVITAVLGLGFIRRYHRQLVRLQVSEQSDGDRERLLSRRIRRLGMLNLFLLLSAVWAMVYKPTL